MGKRWRFLFVGNFFHLSFWLGHFTLDIFFYIPYELGFLFVKACFFLFFVSLVLGFTLSPYSFICYGLGTDWSFSWGV